MPMLIDEVIPSLARELERSNRVVLVAPPGAGKTTRVPLALQQYSRVVMLEPRRIAARAAASFMARSLGEQVGESVGYRVRMDTKVSARTRIEVVTEGVLTRMLQDDPSLDGVGLVIFDEFHERSIHADTALAFALETQAVLRPDLRLLVMSATLDVAAVAELLDDAPVISAAGRQYDVETVYLDRKVDAPIEKVIAATTLRALDRHNGDILVFLPGAAEIRRTAEHLNDAGLPPDTHVLPLHGELPAAEQDRAIAPAQPGQRRIVLATSVAETSITIDGVHVVIDSGLMRVPRFSPRTGMTRLVTVPVSRSAADQRRGRAGRLGPGICCRMWTEGEHAALLEHRPAEIREADLAPLALQLAAWGTTDPNRLKWIDPPPMAAYAQARELLHELEAIDDVGTLTAHGREMAAMPAHPRLAHMMLRAREREDHDAMTIAADLAALLSDRDILRAMDGNTDPDIRLRLPLLHGRTSPPPGHAIHHAPLHRARAEARHWRQRLRAGNSDPASDEIASVLLAFAYPDRIAQQRGTRGRFVLRSGVGVTMDAQHVLAASHYIVAAELGGTGRSARVFLAAPIDIDDIERYFATRIDERDEIAYDIASDTVRKRRVRVLGAIVLGESMSSQIDPEERARVLVEAVREHGIGILPWNDAATSLRQRLAFLHRLDPSAWADVSDVALLDDIDTWLSPHIADNGLRRIDLVHALLSRAGWQRRSDIDRLAPTHMVVPSGSRIAIDYSDPVAPVLAVRIQEMFGATETPRIGDGRVPLTLHLLSPAYRPAQVTRDLAGFWRTTWFDVRKELRGRYPKHYWPEDPLAAEPTRRTRPRGV